MQIHSLILDIRLYLPYSKGRHSPEAGIAEPELQTPASVGSTAPKCSGLKCWRSGFPTLTDLELVGGFNPSEKYESVGSWDDYSQYLEKQKMFQTTNQI